MVSTRSGGGSVGRAGGLWWWGRGGGSTVDVGGLWVGEGVRVVCGEVEGWGERAGGSEGGRLGGSEGGRLGGSEVQDWGKREEGGGGKAAVPVGQTVVPACAM